MSSGTGESEKGLKEILDFSRYAAIIILLLHFYYYCYGAFRAWHITTAISDHFLVSISRTGLFSSINKSKLWALALLFISLLGARGKKDEKVKIQSVGIYLLVGLMLYFFSHFLLQIQNTPETVAAIYMTATSLGFLLILTGGTILSRFIQLRFQRDIFNALNETFPQEERLLSNEYSINLPARYNLKGKNRNSWINILNPFRACLVLGSPGS
jgi:hypothetical protein